MSSAADYAEDARRIENQYIDPESTTQDEIRQDLEDAGFEHGINDIENWFPTVDDVDVPSDPDEAHSGGILTREEVRDRVRDADDVGFSGERTEALTDAVSRGVGAPSRESVQQSQFESISESVAPSDVIPGDDRPSPVSVVRDTEGQIVGTVGTRAAGPDVAEEIGGEYLGTLSEFQGSQRSQPAPDGRRAAIYVETPSGDRRMVDEVDL